MKTLPTRNDLIKELVLPGTIGAEIGVYRADFSRQIYDLCSPKMLYLIDAWESYQEYSLDSLCHTNQDDNMQASKNAMAREIALGRCAAIKGRSVEVAKRWTVPLDWIFLDSNHAYEFVAEDLLAWSAHIKPGGVIMCHDYTETSAGAIAMKFGVVRAVNEFCDKHGWIVTRVTQEPDWPSCAIQKLLQKPPGYAHL